jgi:hypothetical protein
MRLSATNLSLLAGVCGFPGPPTGRPNAFALAVVARDLKSSGVDACGDVPRPRPSATVLARRRGEPASHTPPPEPTQRTFV